MFAQHYKRFQKFARHSSFLALAFHLLVITLLFSQTTIAGELSPDDTLIFEQSPSINSPIHFKQDAPLVPDANNFELMHWQLMSNRNGERWAMVTIKNNATGQRLLAHKDIVATFANGEQSFPVIEVREAFQSKEVRTFSIYFGERRFPIAFIAI